MSGDLISRQAVLDEFWQLEIELRPSAIDAITNMIEQLPSVQPKSETVTEFADRCRECGKRYVKRQTGHWKPTIVRGSKSYICSECSAECCYVTTNYCPSCGARMVETQEGSE